MNSEQQQPQLQTQQSTQLEYTAPSAPAVQVFKATYSGVPVFEMICKGVAVMRRQSDSYLNATQILKVAEFDKPQRTRILEREVQTGEHEKVQGGYGKYQGTWVPFERGRALAEQYNVKNLLQPILEFVRGDQSPPLAPKHATAASNRPRKMREIRARKRPKHLDDDIVMSDIETASQQSNTTPQLSEAPLPPTSRREGDLSGSSPLPQKRSRTARAKDKLSSVPKLQSKMNTTSSRAAAQSQEARMDIDDLSDSEQGAKNNRGNSDEMLDTSTNEPYAQRLLQYFMSNKTTIPPYISRPPRDLDLNVIIDDEGHTSLHWAAAMARIKIVKLLIDNGADIYRVNYKGQTALMRSVLFTNNFDVKTFDSLLDLLRSTIFNIDKRDQTVFHHTAAMSDWKGKIYASRYYMECLINKLKNNQSELISILNVQDTNGDTALTIASKIGNRRLIKLLIEAGASTEIANEEGMTPRDYFGEMEKSLSLRTSSFASSPPSLLPVTVSSPSESTSTGLLNEANIREMLQARVEAIYRNVNKDPTQPQPISEVFDDLAESYEKDLINKERLIEKKEIELDLYKKRLVETKKILESDILSNEDDKEEINAILQRMEEKGKTLELRLRKWLIYRQKEKLRILQNQYLNEEQKPPSPPNTNTLEELKDIAQKLKSELEELRRERKKKTETLIELHSRTPPKKHRAYKRLISACCNVAYENVDVMLGPLLASSDIDNSTSKIRKPTASE
ncbi:hypothetical protein BDF20DRAFT_821551 [Mycotypha africana]|uniref:uncharacterized protein n=1 Tax=Mycotypha africana TaxID=64632 RepID=UPI00230142E3|nr:uncharacterized protein BDF20DRAFT_821551 [Mycotypha africana]KAI8977100.1 hypothetical protein BDF20DRAFT_821551 [Mycotypha africana]